MYFRIALFFVFVGNYFKTVRADSQSNDTLADLSVTFFRHIVNIFIMIKQTLIEWCFPYASPKQVVKTVIKPQANNSFSYISLTPQVKTMIN